MNKLTALIIIILLATLIGGMYGILHDQISYSISSEYYTKFKFVQFGLEEKGWGTNIGDASNPEIQIDNPRLGAAFIGFFATWWVGLISGIALGLIGLFHASGKRMFQVTLRAFLLAIGIAALTGFLGYLYGQHFLFHAPHKWYMPYNLVDIDSFATVGAMHNFSYLGGLIGLFGGLIYSLKRR